MKSYQLSASLILESNLALAFSNILLVISVNFSSNSFSIPSHLIWYFSLVALTTALNSYLSKSLGPNSNLIGTPFTSQWEYFHPGE